MSDEEEEPEISAEEKLLILKFFVTNSPPGHQTTVCRAAKKLNLGDDIADVEKCKAIFREFNISTNVVVSRKEGGNYVIDKAGEIDADGARYLCPRHKEIFTVDHVKGTVTGVKPAKAADLADAGVSKEREALEKALSEYGAVTYGETNTGGYAAEVFAAAPSSLSVVISSEQQKIDAFWSGRWQSHWAVVLADGSAKISGDIRMLCHYFEGGNVQMVLEKDFEETEISFSDPDALAKAVVEKISTAESELQRSVCELYQTMEVLAKGMRRALPRNKQHFDWENYQKYQQIDQWNESSVAK